MSARKSHPSSLLMGLLIYLCISVGSDFLRYYHTETWQSWVYPPWFAFLVICAVHQARRIIRWELSRREQFRPELTFSISAKDSGAAELLERLRRRGGAA